MALINTTTACDYKLKCLEISAKSSLPAEGQLRHAQDMFAWVVAEYVKHEIPVKVTFESKPPMAAALPKARYSATLDQWVSDAQQFGQDRN